jgi:hypothetical protein
MTPQSHFMIFATVRDGQLPALRALLATMNQADIPAHADAHNALLPFGQFKQLHFARFTLIEDYNSEEIHAYGVTPRPWQPTLAFFGDIDGERNDFLAELVARCGGGLSKIFNHCVAFPDANSEGLLAWLQSHQVEPAANYVNWLGRTVQQIHQEHALHQYLASQLPKIADAVGHSNTRVLRQRLLEQVEMAKQTGELTLTPPAPTPLRWLIHHWLHKLGVPLLLLLASPLLLLLAPLYAIWLRLSERSDPEICIRPSSEHIKTVSCQEDWGVSNQFNVFGDVKPSPIRRLSFKFIMLLTDYVTRHIYNRGYLTRIRTIHFARWVLLDDNRRAFFASNYDGSHESYMDDFINKAGWGLNLTFGNAAPYPTTRWFIKEGAYREQQFKYTQRRHQLPSEVWYKAYPDLTATDLSRNTRIRLGLEAVYPSDDDIRAWLSLI